MKIAIAQYNPKVGDLNGNLSKTKEYIEKAKEKKCDLVVFPELSLTGYPPRDLLLRDDFLKACDRALQEIISYTQGIGVIVGTVIDDGNGFLLHNSALLISDGRIIGRVDKSLLPNYDVFEEARYFQPSKEVKCIEFKGMRLGISICEDIWNDEDVFGHERYSRNILDELYVHNPDIFINLSASPYHYGKHEIRKEMLAHYTQKYGIPFVYVNQIGGNDELVFDGSSMIYNADGQLILHGKTFEEDMIIYDTDKSYPSLSDWKEDISWLYHGLVYGVRDYFHKNGFSKALLGLSGGVDSALVACIAAEALGRENVLGVMMPSRYTSQESKDDARQLAKNLGIKYREISIENLFDEYLSIFNPEGDIHGDLAEENIQARIRGNLLMFIANREGRVLLCPSNKSEIAVGYSTLYGDSCGGMAVIGDVLKTEVYQLCRYVNRDNEIIPNNIITKAPTAELREGQKDEDSLPPYSILDKVLKMYIEDRVSLEEIINKGYDRQTVYRIINMIDRAEYKRRQIPPIIKLSDGDFGMGRRHPMVHGFRVDVYN
ncbi:MAG: NAD+ synthase [Clostridiales bacterium]|nr:NAD+ synthase [Clostridiales bacterium]